MPYMAIECITVHKLLTASEKSEAQEGLAGAAQSPASYRSVVLLEGDVIGDDELAPYQAARVKAGHLKGRLEYVDDKVAAEAAEAAKVEANEAAADVTTVLATEQPGTAPGPSESKRKEQAKENEDTGN